VAIVGQFRHSSKNGAFRVIDTDLNHFQNTTFGTFNLLPIKMGDKVVLLGKLGHAKEKGEFGIKNTDVIIRPNTTFSPLNERPMKREDQESEWRCLAIESSNDTRRKLQRHKKKAPTTQEDTRRQRHKKKAPTTQEDSWVKNTYLHIDSTTSEGWRCGGYNEQKQILFSHAGGKTHVL